MSCSLANTYFEMRTPNGKIIEFNFAKTKEGYIMYMEYDTKNTRGEKVSNIKMVSRYESYDPRVGKEVAYYLRNNISSMRTFLKIGLFSKDSEFVYPTAEAAKADFDIIAQQNEWVPNVA